MEGVVEVGQVVYDAVVREEVEHFVARHVFVGSVFLDAEGNEEGDVFFVLAHVIF